MSRLILSTGMATFGTVPAGTGLPVFTVDYRFAPRYRFPIAAEDVRRGYGWLLEGHPGRDAGRVVLAGDSAGGHLAIDLCLDLLRGRQPLPAAQLLLSPLVDAAMGLALAREQVQPDPMWQMHVFQAMPRPIPEAEVALRRGARFLAAAVAGKASAFQRRIADQHLVDGRTA